MKNWSLLITAAVLSTMLLGWAANQPAVAPEAPPIAATAVPPPAPTAPPTAPPATAPPTGSSLTITLAQEQLTQVIQQANADNPSSSEFQFTFDSILQSEPDLIRVNAAFTNLNNGNVRPISIDLRVSVVNERLAAQVVDVSIAGINTNGVVAQIVNNLVLRAIESASNPSNTLVRSVQVRGTTLEIVLGL